ncbi:MAG: tRNA (adenosine(37)-N6)-dimethylallyltransferase MiaA [Chromatiaceae bacterium]|nr:tRNA (adenosine(37)-N6)-dimethylallyltransferase MiaA [Chromatiaceae bacterium]
MGATASGKTALAMQLAERLPFDIVSVDSALVYRTMDIGTAKPGKDELERVPHRLIDICDPSESYSAARFMEDAQREMAEITAAGRVPLLVGGTMLYFRALQYGLSVLPPADASVRAMLEQEAALKGWPAMHRKLRTLDPASAERIHPNDPQRIQRALEVYQLTGSPLSVLQQKDGVQRLPYRIVKLALATADRELLHRRIERRFHRMLEMGFESEVRALLSRGDLVPEMPSMRAVGYRQMVAYLNGEYDHNTMTHKGIVATRQLAKRQITWLRAESDIHWLDAVAADYFHSALNIVSAATI